MKALFAAGISGTALLLLFGLLYDRRNLRVALGGGWWLTALAVLVFGANLSIALFPGRTSYPLGATVLLFLVCACVASRLDDVLGGRSAWQRAAWGLHGALVGWCFVVDLTTRPGVVGDRWITYAVAAILWLGTGLLAAGITLRPAGLAYAGAALLVFMTLPAVAADSFWIPCNQLFEKCSPAGQLFRSFVSSENYIAIVAAFTFIAALSALRGVLRILALANSGVVLVATGSRTGMVAVLAALGVLALLALLRRRGSPVDRVPRALALPDVRGRRGHRARADLLGDHEHPEQAGFDLDRGPQPHRRPPSGGDRGVEVVLLPGRRRVPAALLPLRLRAGAVLGRRRRGRPPRRVVVLPPAGRGRGVDGRRRRAAHVVVHDLLDDRGHLEPPGLRRAFVAGGRPDVPHR